MSKMTKSSKRRMHAAAIGLALMGMVALPSQAIAHEQQAASQPAPAVAADDMTVVRDPETGELRAPTAAEYATMQQAKAAKARFSRVAPQRMVPKFHRSGARGGRLTDEFMTYSIAVRKPDGVIEKQCFESKEAADAALQAVSTTATIKPELE